jgi:hypothetical protein
LKEEKRAAAEQSENQVQKYKKNMGDLDKEIGKMKGEVTAKWEDEM